MLHSGMVLAAPQSGSGKTTITCALLAAMKNRKLAVRAFKSGPDYIDPMFHRQVIGVPSRNLDTFFSGADQIRELYEYDRENFTYSVIEGAMGLYDGLGGTQKEGSAYHLAQTLDLPVVLVLDARGMGRTMVALLAGMLQYDRDHRIIGVILNRTSEGFCRTMTPVIEKELGLPVLGCFPVQKSLHLESRHLGLKMPQEMEGLRKQVNQAAEKLEETADLDRMLQLLQSWALLHAFRDGKTKLPKLQEPGKDKGVLQKKKKQQEECPVIAVAKDEAFCFYYEDNLNLLSEMGAEIVKFSPLENESVPQCDGLILGGGYPELYADILEKNTGTLNSVKECVESGVPCIAECGGFMYLHEIMEDSDKNEHGMVGIIKGKCRKTDRLQRFGYMEMTANRDNNLCKKGDKIRAREFHYFDSDCNGNGFTAVKNDRQWECVNVDKYLFAGFPHLHFFANINFAENFMKSCEEYKCTKSEN